jgi:hypothetical protein
MGKPAKIYNLVQNWNNKIYNEKRIRAKQKFNRRIVLYI